MQKGPWNSLIKAILRIGMPIVLLLAVVFFVGKNWSAQWQTLTSHRFQVNSWLLVLALLGFVLQELSYGLIWRTILARFGFVLQLRSCLRIYLASEFVRYIPGNVWHVLMRTLWAEKYGVPRSIALVSITIELITKLAAGVLIFAVSLFFWPDLSAVRSWAQGTPLLISYGLVSMLALLIALHPSVLNLLLKLALRLLKRDPVVIALQYRTIIWITLAWCGSWIVAGSAFFVLLRSLWPDTPLALLPICIGIYALAWDIGFMSFITPSGLGFREAAITAMFAFGFPLLPTGIAAIIALLSRVVSTVAELLCVSIAYLSGGYAVRSLQREQASLAQMKGLDRDARPC